MSEKVKPKCRMCGTALRRIPMEPGWWICDSCDQSHFREADE